ncbi:MAG: sensor histidine kinase [Actinomycetes bacterium]
MSGRGWQPDPVWALVGLGLATAAFVEVWAPGLAPGVRDVAGDRTVLIASGLLMTLPLALLRRHPLPVLAVVLAAAAAEQLLTIPTEGLTSLIALMLAAYGVAAYSTKRHAYVGATLIVAAGVVIGADDAVFVLVLLLGSWTAGFLVAGRGRAIRALREDYRTLHAQQELAAARGAEAERQRIARELHDVVAHRVSLMVVQAQAAEAVLDGDRQRARTAMLAVETAGRAALVELRILLGMLHRDPAAPTERRTDPQPGLADVSDLVRDAADAGLPITLHMSSEPTAVPAMVGAAAYRVVQESITNVVKHAGGAETEVAVDVGSGAVEVRVRDHGPGPGRGEPTGYGLAGMRERVGFVGGTVAFRERDGGGFEVLARLPLDGRVG